MLHNLQTAYLSKITLGKQPCDQRLDKGQRFGFYIDSDTCMKGQLMLRKMQTINLQCVHKYPKSIKACTWIFAYIHLYNYTQ